MTTASLAVGTRLNLERALKIGDELGGHIVAGHVDGIATHRQRATICRHGALRTAHQRELARFIAAKGSVALDGVSLTVNKVDGRHVLGADHPAHAYGDHARRPGERATRSISRST